MAWNGSHSNKVSYVKGSRRYSIASSQNQGKGNLRYIWHLFSIVLALIIGFVVAIIRFWPHSTDVAITEPETKAQRIKPNKSFEHIVQDAPNEKLPIVEEPKRNVRIERGVEVISLSAKTNQSGVVIEKLTLADGRKIEKVIQPKPIFDNPSDQMIALAISAKPGQSMPPLPALGNIDKEFSESLLSPIRINDNDSDRIKQLKLDVMEARAYIATEIKNGKSVAECLQEHRNEIERIADSHQMAVEKIQMMKEAGASPDDIRLFKCRINELLRARDIPELP